MAVWYDVNRQSDADGAAIATLTDYSGNAKDATQSTAGDRPAMNYDAQYGKRAATFTGGSASGDYMDVGDNLDLDTHGYVMYVALKPELSAAGSKYYVGISKGGPATLAGYLGAYGIYWGINPPQPDSRVYVNTFLVTDIGPPGPPYQLYSADYDETGTMNSTWNVFGAVFTLNSSPKVYMNGTLKATGAGTIPASVSGLDNSKVFYVGRTDPGTADWRANGDIGEVLIYHIDSLSNDNRMKLDGYFCHKWGLGASMDPAHPYYHYPP